MSLKVLVFCDNEGCLVPGKGLDFPLSSLDAIKGFLRDNPWIHFSLCSGRSIPYIEAMTQVLGLSDSAYPSICEGGAALYWPLREKQGSQEVPAYEKLVSFDTSQFLADLERYLPATAYRVEPGKIGCLSLYPNHGWSVASLHSSISEHHPRLENFSVQFSVAAIDITPAGVDKGSGVRAACEKVGIPLSHAVGIGDSDNDLPFLTITGFAGCPVNATGAIKALSHFVAPAESTLGVLQILQHLARLRTSGQFPPP